MMIAAEMLELSSSLVEPSCPKQTWQMLPLHHTTPNNDTYLLCSAVPRRTAQYHRHTNHESAAQEKAGRQMPDDLRCFCSSAILTRVLRSLCTATTLHMVVGAARAAAAAPVTSMMQAQRRGCNDETTRSVATVNQLARCRTTPDALRSGAPLLGSYGRER